MSKLAPRRIITDSSDLEQIKAVQDSEKDRGKDLGSIMFSERGRRWLHGLIFDTCHVNQLSHVPNDTHSSAFNEGARAVGTALLAELKMNHHPLYLKMLEENDDRAE